MSRPCAEQLVAECALVDAGRRSATGHRQSSLCTSSIAALADEDAVVADHERRAVRVAQVPSDGVRRVVAVAADAAHAERARDDLRRHAATPRPSGCSSGWRSRGRRASRGRPGGARNRRARPWTVALIVAELGDRLGEPKRAGGGTCRACAAPRRARTPARGRPRRWRGRATATSTARATPAAWSGWRSRRTEPARSALGRAVGLEGEAEAARAAHAERVPVAGARQHGCRPCGRAPAPDPLAPRPARAARSAGCRRPPRRTR